jgi:2-oxoglutarate dehydrogenase E2 component (dihydrolipoamide succinyltransferase)
MLIEVKVPQLSESVSEATLVKWHKKEGDAVSRDENLIDIETDKVVLETPAPADGVIVKLVKVDGDTVTSGELIAQIDTEAKGAAKAAPAAAPAKAEAKLAQAAAAASPAARKILAEKGVSADEVAGSGRGGRVTKEDAVAAGGSSATPPTAPKSACR